MTTAIFFTLLADKLGLTDPDTLWLIPAAVYRVALFTNVI